jgi:hypothetical protein
MLEGKGHVFMVEGGELKLPDEALKAIPELEGRDEVTQEH